MVSRAEMEIDFDEVVHESDSAWKVLIDDRTVWLPKSNCELDEMENKATVPKWLARKEGLV